jgi:hypothetical protein
MALDTQQLFGMQTAAGMISNAVYGLKLKRQLNQILFCSIPSSVDKERFLYLSTRSRRLVAWLAFISKITHKIPELMYEQLYLT